MREEEGQDEEEKGQGNGQEYPLHYARKEQVYLNAGVGGKGERYNQEKDKKGEYSPESAYSCTSAWRKVLLVEEVSLIGGGTQEDGKGHGQK